MRALGRFLAERSVVELGAAVAIGFGLWQLYDQAGAVFLQAIIPADEFRYVAHLGRHEIVYFYILTHLIALGLLLATAWLIVRKLRLTTWSDAELRDCPHCLAEIPVAAQVCQFCTRDVPAPA